MPVSERIGPPQPFAGGWFRCQWLEFNETNLLLETAYKTKKTDWQRAWHGCKLEALYSIMYHGKVNSSSHSGQGHRFFDNEPGIYLHKQKTAIKADGYTRFVPLCKDGVFWRAKWEVRANREERVSKKNTDQWIQQSDSVRLVALWFQGLRYEDMTCGYEISTLWNPLLEANPLRCS